MKKLLTILFLFISVKCFSQNYGTPHQQQGSVNIGVDIVGGQFIKGTFVTPIFVDTTAANLTKTSLNNFSEISTTSDTSKWYRFNGKWYKLATTTTTNPINAWNLIGNAGTTAGTNFVGTIDNQDLVFKRNNVQSGLLNNASANTSFGVGAWNPLSTGVTSSAFGFNALHTNTTGSYNTADGYGALTANTTGSQNTAHGYDAGLNITTANFSALFGGEAGINLFTGDGNSLFGQYSNTKYNNTRYSGAFGYHAVADTNYQMAFSDSFTNIKAKLNGQVAGYVLTTNGTTANWQPSGTGGSPTLQNVFNNGNILNRNDSIVATGHSFKLFADNILFPQNLPSGDVSTDSIVTIDNSGHLKRVDVTTICTGGLQGINAAILDSTSAGYAYLKVHVGLGLFGQGSGADPIIVDTGYLSTLYHTDSSSRALTLQQSIINNDTLTQANIIHSEGHSFGLNADGITFNSSSNLLLEAGGANGLFSGSNGYTLVSAVNNYLELESDTDILITTQLSSDTLSAGGGTANQVLTSNGLGRWSWEDAGGGGGNGIYGGSGVLPSDVVVSGQGLYGITFDSLANGLHANMYSGGSNIGSVDMSAMSSGVNLRLHDNVNNTDFVDFDGGNNEVIFKNITTGGNLLYLNLNNGFLEHKVINSGNIFSGFLQDADGSGYIKGNNGSSASNLIAWSLGGGIQFNSYNSSDITATSAAKIIFNATTSVDINATTSTNISNTDNTQVPLIVQQASGSTQDVVAFGRSTFGNFIWGHSDGNWEATSLTQDVFNSSMVTTDGSGKLIAATAGVDYQSAISFPNTSLKYLTGYNTFGSINDTIRNAISLTTTGSSGAATYSPSTGVLNIPQYVSPASPIIVKSADLTNQSAAGNILTYTTGAADSSFTVSAYLTITAITAGTLQVQVVYTDETNASRTVVLFPMGLTSAGLTAAGTANYAVMGELRVKASTTITVQTSATVTLVGTTFFTGATLTKIR